MLITGLFNKCKKIFLKFFKTWSAQNGAYEKNSENYKVITVTHEHVQSSQFFK